MDKLSRSFANSLRTNCFNPLELHPSWLLFYSCVFFVWRTHRAFHNVLVSFNSLNPESDQHLTALHSHTAKSFIKFVRIKGMMANLNRTKEALIVKRIPFVSTDGIAQIRIWGIRMMMSTFKCNNLLKSSTSVITPP